MFLSIFVQSLVPDTLKVNQYEAVKWYRKAAEQGLAEAQSALGSCYANGRGVDKDYLEAIKAGSTYVRLGRILWM